MRSYAEKHPEKQEERKEEERGRVIRRIAAGSITFESRAFRFLFEGILADPDENRSR